MPPPLHHIPLTPLDELRACLGGHPEADASAQLRLSQLLQQLRQTALPELGARLTKTSSDPGLRRFLLGLTAKFDWPEWVPLLFQFLQHEPDLGLFDAGCAALGSLEIPAAREALKKLAALRTDPERQLILRRELGPEEPLTLSSCLGRLLKGAENPRLAHQGARNLAALAKPEDIPTLWEALATADPIAFRMLLRLITGLPGSDAGPRLLELFLDVLHNLEDLDALETLTHQLQTGVRTAARTQLAAAISERFGERHVDPVRDLQQALAAGEGGNPIPPLGLLRSAARGPYEHFLLEALTLLAEGKAARFSATITEARSTAAAQQLSHGATLNLVCECLWSQANAGQLPVAQVLPTLLTAFNRFSQSEGLDQVFCRLVPPADEGALACILKLSDPARRAACLDVLGTREEDALVPFFLQATQDPIEEIGQRAMHHLAKLPSSFPVVMDLFRSSQPEQVRRALQIFKENATQAAAEPLMAFLNKADVRDDLLVEAVEALGATRCPSAAPVLLDLLHDGKPANLQLTLVEALTRLATQEAGLGMLAKSANLKLPLVLITALEGVLAAFPSFERPLPKDALPSLEQLLSRCCDNREGEGQHLRAIYAAEHLYCFDQDLYTRLQDTFSDHLFHLRTKGNWDRESNDRVSAIIKELGRRSASLGHMAGREEKTRAMIQAVPPQGPGRAPALLALREALQEADFILREELARELADFVIRELGRKDQDWRELARLCEIAGATRQLDLAEPLKEIFNRATGLGLRSAAKEGFLALGMDEADLSRRAPIRTILLLEPSSFFRKRLLGVLAQGRKVEEVASRTEAEAILSDHPVDLLISEQADAAGDLRPWLKMQVELRRCRQVFLSTATREANPEEPWLMGTLYKPYAPEQLLKALEP